MSDKNSKSALARKQLIDMSKEAQSMMELVDSGIEIEGFEGCEKVNDFLLVMHQNATGCNTFKTFKSWKDDGFKVKKGETSFRVWGSPLKAKKKTEEEQAAPDSDNNQGSEDETYKYWPMCSLFNESQVEKLEAES